SAVGIEGFLSDALDLQQIIDRLERPMLLAVGDDGLGLLRANTVQGGQCLGVGGIEVDGGRCGNQRYTDQSKKKNDSPYEVHAILLLNDAQSNSPVPREPLARNRA